MSGSTSPAPTVAELQAGMLQVMRMVTVGLALETGADMQRLAGFLGQAADADRVGSISATMLRELAGSLVLASHAR